MVEKVQHSSLMCDEFARFPGVGSIQLWVGEVKETDSLLRFSSKFWGPPTGK